MTTATEHNSALRRGQKLPPPPTSEYSVNNTYCEAIPTALLHSAYAVRGRDFLCLLSIKPQKTKLK